MAEVVGFEPTNVGAKNRCLAAWLHLYKIFYLKCEKRLILLFFSLTFSINIISKILKKINRGSTSLSFGEAYVLYSKEDPNNFLHYNVQLLLHRLHKYDNF